MSKGQKRPSKEPKKAKSDTKADKKKAGPKYLRESEVPQMGSLAARAGRAQR